MIIDNIILAAEKFAGRCVHFFSEETEAERAEKLEQWNSVVRKECARLLAGWVLVDEGFEPNISTACPVWYRTGTWYKIRHEKIDELLGKFPGLKEHVCRPISGFLVNTHDIRNELEKHYNSMIDVKNLRRSLVELWHKTFWLLNDCLRETNLLVLVQKCKEFAEWTLLESDLKRDVLLEAKEYGYLTWFTGKQLATFNLFRDYLDDNAPLLLVEYDSETVLKCALCLTLCDKERFLAIGASHNLSEQFSALWDKAHELFAH